MKRCSVCKEEKPLDEFHNDRRAKDGKLSACKPCQLKRSKASYRKHREKKLAWQKKYYAENPERKAATQRKYYEKNKGKRIAYGREWKRRNKDKQAEYWKRYYEKNREQELKRAEKYREENREAIYARRDWEKHIEGMRRRRARQLDAYVAPVKVQDIILRDQGHCGICGEPIIDDTLELDHIIPLARGGTHEPDNTQLAHRTCNRRKHARVDFTLRDAA